MSLSKPVQLQLSKLGGLLVGLGLILAAAGPALAQRELAVEPEQLVEVEIATVAIASNGSPVVLLREPNANKVVPIFIGPEQAMAISHALRSTRMPRPMTHDLLINVIGALQAELQRVYVDDLRGRTFYGMLELTVPGRDEPVRVDSRPSDALALAVRAGAGIFISPEVLKAAQAIEYQGLEDEVVTAVGITVNRLTGDLRKALALPEMDGVLVSNVTGPARQAGLRPGALILQVNEGTPTTPMEFLELVRTTPEGQKVSIRYWQNGEEHQLQVSTEVPEPERFHDWSAPGVEL
ncbi:bifunctional nuclease domain-containing protein [Desulfurivibrio alkaliphilus]|uniref:BFN domain-containing protein n=1 Tax=Desulfurivibrio alkaliphilus (strain DSM 19089 / UNIQEM U267 / AHT2) TaxID=589865 RepID=D6Z0Q5_DESAT|nr:bifunctional nuclease domain-containing protein [Desulfurivibrio alkaliphilus]ADH85284.1 protein of unknown function DUF151 [Desulfurivibrio alkaliphilus AHT 2]